jgi:hypothetical protein
LSSDHDVSVVFLCFAPVQIHTRMSPEQVSLLILEGIVNTDDHKDVLDEGNLTITTRWAKKAPMTTMRWAKMLSKSHQKDLQPVLNGIEHIEQRNLPEQLSSLPPLRTRPQYAGGIHPFLTWILTYQRPRTSSLYSPCSTRFSTPRTAYSSSLF